MYSNSATKGKKQMKQGLLGMGNIVRDGNYWEKFVREIWERV